MKFGRVCPFAGVIIERTVIRLFFTSLRSTRTRGAFYCDKNPATIGLYEVTMLKVIIGR
ncbi:hypothetical protein C8Q76DRAFT_748400 [Earliella scabrosa]|nr:hypothetical protein C8Q76DRAFT_748400 [Earliella scabrosa]